MKHIRLLPRFFGALCALAMVAVFTLAGQRLGWCQEKERPLTPEELACIDSGLSPEECRADGNRPNVGGVASGRGARGGITGLGDPNTSNREVRKEPKRSKIQLHK